MVRNKPAPQQLNEVQQRRAQWNMVEGAGPADQAQAERPPPPQEEENDDDIQFLLNDELEDESDDNDVEVIPQGIWDPPHHQPARARWGRRRRRVRFDSDSDDEVVEIPVRRQRAPAQPDYGDFTEVLDRSQFYAKISRAPVNERSKNIFCCFGNVIVKLQDQNKDEQVDQIPGSEFWIYVSPEANQSAAYFEWTSSGSPKKKNQRKKTAENFCFFRIEGILDTEFWQGLSTQRYFELRLETFDQRSNEMTIGVYLKKGGLSELKHASESIQCPQALGVVVSYFFGVHVTSYTGDKVMKHDLDELYEAIKELHADKEYCSLDVQHSSLIPQLRPYQKLAVKWMLYQEKFGQDTEGPSTECDRLHCLYVDLKSRDGQTFYFNKYAGFLVKDKPLAVLPTPGGILADEMGLGKTVEVLACMLCHPRQSVPKPEYLEPIVESNSCKQNGRSSRKTRGQDIYTLEVAKQEGEANEGISEEGNKKMDADSDSIVSSVVQQAGVEQTEDSSVSEGRSRKRKKTSKCGIKVHLPVPKDTPEGKSELTRTGRPKRNASKFVGGYASAGEDSEEEEDYEPPEKTKKRRSKTDSSGSGSSNNNRYNVEKEISECSMWSAIESVIINESWEGNIKEYKKNGSYKEFRKFLKMRKKDPYYMMSNYERLLVQYNSDIAMYSAKDEVSRKTIQGFFDTKVEQKSYFECLCGSSEGKDRDDKLRMQCGACSLWQHAECVQYDVSDPYRGPYFCPHCWTQESPVMSGATLIVSPSAISYQVSTPRVCCSMNFLQTEDAILFKRQMTKIVRVMNHFKLQ